MFREEKDSLGTMKIPDEFYYGIQTLRSLELSNISGRQISQDAPWLIHSLATIKKAAALANHEIGALDTAVCHAIVQATDEIREGRFKDQFPVDMFQGGGGIAVHMNINEVIANRANELITGHKGYSAVHPNTHVNQGQSTNDVLPSAMKIALLFMLEQLISEVNSLKFEMDRKADQFKHVVKIGRTCLQDALPLTLGQEFSGYASFLDRQIRFLQAIAAECLELPLGATAVGTGVGILPGFLDKAYGHIRSMTGKPFTREHNFFDGLQNGDLYLKISAALKALATGLSKIASDFRLMSSGPKAGLNEIKLPALQPGSSIMPGKINPVLPELINQVCYQVCGNDTAVTMAVEGGELDLNVWESIITKCLFESCTLLTKSIPIFATQCVSGIEANLEVCREYSEGSTAVSALISAVFDYETGSRIAKEAIRTNQSVKDVVIQSKLMTEEDARLLLNPINMTDSNQMDELIYQMREKLRKA
ncbi:aspartate ammonia-lyase [Paenibacillus sp. RC67]|uniref:aspartate ammonia-lyase n=1 Tax=Paenibacillus sp. RC67 TaxID=3039392 RepID=UPI0024ADE1EB|nr:aspartate ammonia-lyase [Paenibacillus sp. RC67]